jgi:hypothetical protein
VWKLKKNETKIIFILSKFLETIYNNIKDHSLRHHTQLKCRSTQMRLYGTTFQKALVFKWRRKNLKSHTVGW